MAEKPEGNSVMERHAQTIIGAILIGLIIWVGQSSMKGLEADARQEAKLETMADEIKELRKAFSVMNLGAVEERINGLERRVSVIEGRVHD